MIENAHQGSPSRLFAVDVLGLDLFLTLHLQLFFSSYNLYFDYIGFLRVFFIINFDLFYSFLNHSLPEDASEKFSAPWLDVFTFRVIGLSLSQGLCYQWSCYHLKLNFEGFDFSSFFAVLLQFAEEFDIVYQSQGFVGCYMVTSLHLIR